MLAAAWHPGVPQRGSLWRPRRSWRSAGRTSHQSGSGRCSCNLQGRQWRLSACTPCSATRVQLQRGCKLRCRCAALLDSSQAACRRHSWANKNQLDAVLARSSDDWLQKLVCGLGVPANMQCSMQEKQCQAGPAGSQLGYMALCSHTSSGLLAKRRCRVLAASCNTDAGVSLPALHLIRAERGAHRQCHACGLAAMLPVRGGSPMALLCHQE